MIKQFVKGRVYVFIDAATDSVTINALNLSVPNNLKVDVSTLYIDASGDQVGIGTTSPSYKLHLEGQCVTGDTLLPVIRMVYGDSKNGSLRGAFAGTWRRSNPAFKNEIASPRQTKTAGGTRNDEDSSQIEYIPITKVKPGDYVLSLNEETGAIEPHRINGLLDMGVKPVFKLTTALGRTIRTTGNHTYLTKNGWIRVAELRPGEKLAIAKSDSVDSVTAFSDHRQTSPKVFFADIGKEVFENRDDFAYRQQVGAQEDNSEFSADRVTQNIAEVSIAGNQYQRISADECVDFLVSGSGLKVTDIQNFVAGSLKSGSEAAGAICINEKLHPGLGRLSDQLFFVSQKSGEKYAGADIFVSNRAIFPFNFSKTHSRSQSLKDSIDRNARSFNTRPAVLDIGIYTNMFFHNFFINHFNSSFLIILEKAYHTVSFLSSRLSTPPVFALPASSNIHYPNSDILWDTIASIEYTGYEQVYDIEVEGTHNFVAGHFIEVKGQRSKVKGDSKNASLRGARDLTSGDEAISSVPSSSTLHPSPFFGGIIAHNTYINGAVQATGNTTLGDNLADTVTINALNLAVPSNLKVDISTLYIDATNDRVGIGTTNPTEKLEVADSGKKSFEVRPGTAYVSLMIDGTEVARLRQ